MDSEAKRGSEGSGLHAWHRAGHCQAVLGRTSCLCLHLVFEFLIDRPNRDLSSSENIIDIATLDDQDDQGGLYAFIECGGRGQGKADRQEIEIHREQEQP